MANVRFYRLPALPVWDAKYEGIFVHINGDFNPFDDSKSITVKKGDIDGKVWKYGKQVTSEKDLYWINDKDGEREQEFTVEGVEGGKITGIFTYRDGSQVYSGLWFGGTNGWELLTNDTDVNYINTLITNKINELDVSDYAQAEITTSETNSSLTIKGIKEVDGKISVGNNNVNVSVEIDGAYSSSNKIATVSTVTNKINTLDVSTIPTLVKVTDSNNTTLTLKGVKETDGKIEQGEGTETFTVGDGILKLSGKGATTSNTIPSAVDTDVFSANDTTDSTITLGDEFVWNGMNKTIGLRVKTAVTGSNNLVTESDIASLAGAMHYVGAIQKVSTTVPTSGNYYTAIVGSDTYYLIIGANQTATEKTPAAGDTLIVSGTANDVTPFETGDMFVYSDANKHANVVQTNMTLGVGNGQIASNDGALTSGNLIIATNNGIQTTSYSLSGASDRTQSLTNDNPEGNGTTGDANIIHGTTETDTITILGKDNAKTLKIASANASIDIRKKTDSNSEIDIDLVWNTVLN